MNQKELRESLVSNAIINTRDKRGYYIATDEKYQGYYLYDDGIIKYLITDNLYSKAFWDTKESAEAFYERWRISSTPTTVYLTRRNSDINEGKGPMVNDLCFAKNSHAELYIDNQPGVQDRRHKWSEEKYGDWEVIELEVLTYSDTKIEELKQALFDRETAEKQAIMDRALGKLSDVEKETLGLKNGA